MAVFTYDFCTTANQPNPTVLCQELNLHFKPVRKGYVVGIEPSNILAHGKL